VPFFFARFFADVTEETVVILSEAKDLKRQPSQKSIRPSAFCE
jgi:hypothetical protein